ncbi:transcriptional regulator [Austwickia chelonae]|uniref:Uncharacterized protein n=2 Tax=Austwickia TaxID=1184606 RepID=K6ULD8_9MICO|nr:hypothetical protein AUCHE_05_00660 [Austwickia chelonae NBRC 105200]SEW04162.1 transcriptional regulator [Austwickia chelonae]
MVAAKTERLLNVVICLLYTRRPLTRDQIRSSVAAYASTTSDEAFERMFERDKGELRDLGIPLITEQLDTFFDDEPGYRIDRREYDLPELHFTPDELAVLALANRTWAQASLSGPAATALRKLAADGVERDNSSIIGIEARIRTHEPTFEPVRAAVVDTCPITFTYTSAHSGQTRPRKVHPWGLTSWRGHWYLTALDTDLNEPRIFRLSRIQGEVRRTGQPGSYDVPPGHRPRAFVQARISSGDPFPAQIAVRPGTGHALRRRAATTATDPTRPGWDILTLHAQDTENLAQELASYGPDVIALSPHTVIDALTRTLRKTLETHRDTTPGTPQ